MFLNPDHYGTGNRVRSIGIQKGIVLYSFSFLKERSNIKKPDIVGLHKGETERPGNGGHRFHGSQFRGIIGKGRTLGAMSLTVRLLQSDFDSTQLYESLKTGLLFPR
jgi:hypothetical protein